MPPSKFLLPVALVVGAVLLGGSLLLLVRPSVRDIEKQAAQTVGPLSAASGAGSPSSTRPDESNFVSGSGSDARETLLGVIEESENATETEEGIGSAAGPNWEAPINSILESAEDNDTVAMRLNALGPSLPLDGHLEATQHMVNLLSDESYQPALQKLVNPATPPEVMEVIYSDVLNRPNAVKLPVLINLLAVPGHPLRGEALDTLQIFVGRDLGNDTQAWSAAVQEFLRAEASANGAPSEQ